MALHKPVQQLTQQPINPKTGRLWRLTDPEVSSGVDSLEKSLADPQKALEYLKRHGLITPTGKVAKKYGGR